MMENEDDKKICVKKYSSKEERAKRRQHLTGIGYYDPKVIRKHQQDMAEMIADLEALGLSMGLALRLHKAYEQENCFHGIHKAAKYIDDGAFYQKWLPRMREMNIFYTQYSYSRAVLGFPLDL